MPNDTASDLNRRYYTFTGILSLITPSDSQYKQGLDYSEYKQGLPDIARKGPLGHGTRRTLLAYDQISHLER